MNYAMVIIVSLMSGFNSTQLPESDYELPESWTKEFRITASFTGSMSGTSTHITFTYDSCMYETVSRTGRLTNRFALTETDRRTILKKLRDLNADEIESEMSTSPVRDGWSNAFCFDYHCVEGGASAQMSDDDKKQFHEVYNYLEQFAATKKK